VLNNSEFTRILRIFWPYGPALFLVTVRRTILNSCEGFSAKQGTLSKKEIAFNNWNTVRRTPFYRSPQSMYEWRDL